MGLIIALTFLGIFAAIALPMAMAVSNSGSSRKAGTALSSAIKVDRPKASEKSLDVRRHELLLSSIPWLNNKLRNLHITSHLRRLFSQADLNWNPGRVLLVTGLLFVLPASLFLLWFKSMLLGLVAGLALATLPYIYARFLRDKRLRKFEEQLPEALDMMVSALRAGNSLIASMDLVARECPDPLASEFRICVEEQNFGLDLKTAIDNFYGRIPLPDLSVFATAIMVQKESGGNLAEVLDKTAYLIRERFRLQRQVRTHTAQGRLTGVVLVCVPIGLGIAMYLVNPDSISVLWHRDIGIKLIWGAAGLIVVGAYIISRIVDIDV